MTVNGAAVGYEELATGSRAAWMRRAAQRETIVMTDDGFEALTTRIPGDRGEVIEGGSHQLRLDQPARVAAAIEGFVNGLRR